MKSLTFRDVSRCRAWLYGLAAAWILFHHMTFTLPDGAMFLPLRLLKEYGYCGADVFVLLSAMGLHRSFQKDGRVLRFYLRRLERVLLPAAIVSAVYYGLRFSSTASYAEAILLPPFWYVPFILAMYLVYPLIYRLQQKSRWSLPVLLALSVALPAMVYRVSPALLSRWPREIPRVTVFLTGCMLAPAADRSARIHPAHLLWMTAGFFAVKMLPVWPLSLCDGLFLGLFFIAAMTLLARLLLRSSGGRFIFRFFAFLGGVSLELYLIQPRLCSMLSRLDIYTSGRCSPYKLELFNTLATILLAVLLQSLCEALTGRFRKTSAPKEPSYDDSSV